MRYNMKSNLSNYCSIFLILGSEMGKGSVGRWGGSFGNIYVGVKAIFTVEG